MYCRFYSTGSRCNTILRRWSSLYWLVSLLTHANCSKRNHFQTVTKWKAMGITDWRNKYFVMSLSMWHLYSWTNVTEMAKRSTTGFSLQCQSPYQSNQWWELQRSSTGIYSLDVPTNSQNSDVKRNERQWRKIDSLNMVLWWWKWKVTHPVAKSTCPRYVDGTFFKPCSRSSH